MSEPVPAPDAPPTLLEQVQQEQQAAAAPCDDVQPDVTSNVCVREPDHPGPHVGVQPDGTYVQWEV